MKNRYRRTIHVEIGGAAGDLGVDQYDSSLTMPALRRHSPSLRRAPLMCRGAVPTVRCSGARSEGIRRHVLTSIAFPANRSLPPLTERSGHLHRQCERGRRCELVRLPPAFAGSPM